MKNYFHRFIAVLVDEFDQHPLRFGLCGTSVLLWLTAFLQFLPLELLWITFMSSAIVWVIYILVKVFKYDD